MPFVLLLSLVSEAALMFAFSLRASTNYSGGAKMATLDEWRSVQAQRRQTLADYCGYYIPVADIVQHIHSPQTFLEWSPSFIVHEKYNVVNCNIPKVASTSVKIMTANVTGELPEKNLTDEFMYHRWENLGSDELIGMNQLAKDQIKDRLERFTSFLFVRHPLDRLLSAYRGKIESHGVQRIEESVKAISVLHRKTYTSDVNITFSEFVDWLLAKKDNDNHWKSFENTCYPCHVMYKYIGHVETLREDTFYILLELYGEDAAKRMLDHVPHLNQNDQMGMKRFVAYFRQLSRKQLHALNLYVDGDLKAFGYKEIPV